MSIDTKRAAAVDWKCVVDRREAMLTRSFTGGCYSYFEEMTGIPWRATAEFRPGSPVLYSGKELGELRSYFLKAGLPAYHDFRNRCVAYLDTFDALGTEIAHMDCSALSPDELKALVNRFIEAALRANVFLLPMAIIDGLLSSMILEALPQASDEQKQNWLGILAYPSKENSHTEEERDLLKIAVAAKAGQDVRERIEAHAKTYGWIGARQYWWNLEWKAADVQKRLENILAQGDPSVSLQHMETVKQERAKACQELMEQLGISQSSTLHDVILLAKEYAYLRTWRTDVIYRAGFRARNVFYEVVKRVGLPAADVIYLTCHEVRRAVETGVSPVDAAEIAKRKVFFGTLLLDGQYYVLSGTDGETVAKQIYQMPSEDARKEIKGNIAYKGMAKGRVKIVLRGDQIDKVERGDVLVAVMTFPNFVPAMEKAAAFVTDEGGILCHAAIVSREMKKPCIIATKIATKVLKDGMMVEVDAEKGLVKVL